MQEEIKKYINVVNVFLPSNFLFTCLYVLINKNKCVNYNHKLSQKVEIKMQFFKIKKFEYLF